MEHHDHSHGHAHSHSHSPVLKNVTLAFVFGIVLNFIFVVIEVVTGLSIHSLSLLSDAGHNLADVAALALSLLAYRLMKIKPNKKYTYGYRKTSILVALFNAVVLLLSIGAIIYEAIQQIGHPRILPGFTIAIVAGIGILINTASALFFLKDKDKDLNIKSAYLHLMSDALVSLGIVIGGIIIYYKQWYWLDPVISIAIALVILKSTYKLLKSTLKLSLDGVPDHIQIEEVHAKIIETQGVISLHHVHIWAISTTENALTAHLVLENETTGAEESEIKHKIKHALAHCNIQHITLETEKENDPCERKDC
jgi:cobalt-zinc-cadmium efflux system protein